MSTTRTGAARRPTPVEEGASAEKSRRSADPEERERRTSGFRTARVPPPSSDESASGAELASDAGSFLDEMWDAFGDQSVGEAHLELDLEAVARDSKPDLQTLRRSGSMAVVRASYPDRELSLPPDPFEGRISRVDDVAVVGAGAEARVVGGFPMAPRGPIAAISYVFAVAARRRELRAALRRHRELRDRAYDDAELALIDLGSRLEARPPAAEQLGPLLDLAERARVYLECKPSYDTRASYQEALRAIADEALILGVAEPHSPRRTRRARALTANFDAQMRAVDLHVRALESYSPSAYWAGVGAGALGLLLIAGAGVFAVSAWGL